MARYDRTFLVPYLNDICTLHLSKKKVSEMIEEERGKINGIVDKAVERVTVPKLEVIKENDIGVGAMLLSMLLLVISPCVMFTAIWEGVGNFIIGFGLLLVACGFFAYSFKCGSNKIAAAKMRNANKEQQYELEKKTAMNSVAPMIREHEGRIEFYSDEIAKMDALLAELYSANVIPRWYRDLYPAVYLDDWFSNGRSDDLDMALNTLVLEEIKDKLDVIIKNQGEELINQRIMIANQVKAMEQQERHHRALMSKLDEIQATNEERNSYLQMINANTATSAFYARASYLRSC